MALLAGLALFSVGNTVYGRLALSGNYYAGHLIDLAWIEGFIGVGIASLLATHNPSDVPAFRNPMRLRWAAIVRATLLMTSILSGLT